MAFDKDGNIIVRAQPKPVKQPKKGGSSTKSIKSKAIAPPNKVMDQVAIDLKMKRIEQNRINRQFGKAVERGVAKVVGGERTPMSGAVKNSNRNLTGDVEVKDARGRDFLKLEVKATKSISVRGDKMFTFKKSVADQTFREAEEAGEIGCLVIHFGGESHQKDYYVWEASHAIRIIELAKLGTLVESGAYTEKGES